MTALERDIRLSKGDGAVNAGVLAMARRTNSTWRLMSLLSAATSGFGRGGGRGRWGGGVDRFRRAGARGRGISVALGQMSAREYGSGGARDSANKGSTAREDGEFSGIDGGVDRGGTGVGLLWCLEGEGMSEPQGAR